MAHSPLLLVLLAVGPAAADARAFSNNRAFLSANMQPEVVARTLRNVEEEWKAQAALFSGCNSTENNGISLVDCTDAPLSFAKSCGLVVGAVVQGSSGDKKVSKEYMTDVCSQSVMKGWHQTQCHSLATAISGAMSADSYQNRYNFNSDKLCGSLWSNFLKEEEKHLAEEKARHEAEEKKAEEEEKVAREAAEKKAAEEAARKKIEAAEDEKAEALVKADEAAALVVKKKAEAVAIAKAAEEKKAEAAQAAKDHEEAQEKLKVKNDIAKAAPPAPVAAAKSVAAPIVETKAAPASVEAKVAPVAAKPAPVKAAVPVAAKTVPVKVEAKASVPAKK